MRNTIDIDDLKSIGIVEFYSSVEEHDDFKKGFFEIFIPKTHSYKRGEMYLLRFVYLDGDTAGSVFTDEVSSFTCEKLEDNSYNICGTIVKLNNEQFNKICMII